MQEQKLEYEVVKGEGELPAALVEQMQAADALLFIGMREDGVLNVQGTVKGGVFLPEQDKAHAYVAAIYAENAYLLDVVNGRTTDADRFRALRDFAVLANTDTERFERVNVMLQQFEDASTLPAENAKRTEADQVRIADFLVQALIDTAPPVPDQRDAERLAAAEEKRTRRAGLRLMNANGLPLN